MSAEGPALPGTATGVSGLAAPMRLRAEPPRVTRLSRRVLAGLGLAASIGVGIGFGMQNVVNNFISGILLLVVGVVYAVCSRPQKPMVVARACETKK